MFLNVLHQALGLYSNDAIMQCIAFISPFLLLSVYQLNYEKVWNEL